MTTIFHVTFSYSCYSFSTLTICSSFQRRAIITYSENINILFIYASFLSGVLWGFFGILRDYPGISVGCSGILAQLFKAS